MSFLLHLLFMSFIGGVLCAVPRPLVFHTFAYCKCAWLSGPGAVSDGKYGLPRVGGAQPTPPLASSGLPHEPLHLSKPASHLNRQLTLYEQGTAMTYKQDDLCEGPDNPRHVVDPQGGCQQANSHGIGQVGRGGKRPVGWERVGVDSILNKSLQG